MLTNNILCESTKADLKTLALRKEGILIKDKEEILNLTNLDAKALSLENNATSVDALVTGLEAAQKDQQRRLR